MGGVTLKLHGCPIASRYPIDSQIENGYQAPVHRVRLASGRPATGSWRKLPFSRRPLSSEASRPFIGPTLKVAFRVDMASSASRQVNDRYLPI